MKPRFSLKSPFLPDPWLVVELLQRKRYARISQQAGPGGLRQWFLLFGQVSKEWLVSPQPAQLRKLFPPDDRAWADPFLWSRGGQWFIFCEQWLANTPHAHIAVIQISQEGRLLSPAQPVLEKDHHLSYPFLFEFEGVLHMVPEGGAGRAIEVYQCEEFPGRWRKRATLMSNLRYADATLLEHQAKWWLFVTIKRGVFALTRDLFIFWADTPLADKWNPLPGNPVVRGFRSARPAGRFFELGGKLFRPSQNCLIRYGHSLRINEVTRLDAMGYAERPVAEAPPGWEENILANHHIDWRQGAVVMDAQRGLARSRLPG